MKIYTLTCIEAVIKLLLQYTNDTSHLALQIFNYLLIDPDKRVEYTFTLEDINDIHEVCLRYVDSVKRFIVVINPL